MALASAGALTLYGTATSLDNHRRVKADEILPARLAYAKAAAPALASITMKHLYPMLLVDQRMVTADSNFADLLGLWIPWTDGGGANAGAAFTASLKIDGFLWDPFGETTRSASGEVMGLMLMAGEIDIQEIKRYNPYLETTAAVRTGGGLMLNALVADIQNGRLVNSKLRVRPFNTSN